MEQMYLVEIFIDKVTIFMEDEETSGANKKLIIKIKFGPKVQFIIKEGQLAVSGENGENLSSAGNIRKNESTDDVVECDEATGKRKWSRTIRVGKSYLFPSYPDTVLMILSKFPLEIEVWNDDENEVEIFVGIGTMQWETEFFHMLKETADACRLHDPLSIKQLTPLYAECCCKRVGEIAFILRLSALGDSIITEFQQLMDDPESFVFRTNKAPSMFQCKRVEGDDPNFCMVGSIYETTTLEDPEVLEQAQKKIEICTELQSCGVVEKNADYSCEHAQPSDEPPKKKYPIKKIRMGDIIGPCGNTNCSLAHKVRTYIRNLESYKKGFAALEDIGEKKEPATKKICGSCDCKDDRWHRDGCPDKEKEPSKATCAGCGGVTKLGDTCDDRRKKLTGTNATPRASKTQVTYVTETPGYKEAMFGKDFTIQNLTTKYNFQDQNQTSNLKQIIQAAGCCCRQLDVNTLQAQTVNIVNAPSIKTPCHTISSRSMGINNQLVYNAEVPTKSTSKTGTYNFCTDIPDDKDCRCNPPKPTPPCKTLNCDCITETINIAARKTHKAFCPLYKHKENCPVNLMFEDEENLKEKDEEDEAEPLPYGLPPIQLGPCPVMGRPCTVPDGFARMYKTGALPAQPPSYSDAGKVCCSKEYERIKKAIKEYMKYEKEHDFRCINKFNVDTERRCCDKDQVLLALTGKGCCGAHKLSIQEKFKDKK